MPNVQVRDNMPDEVVLFRWESTDGARLWLNPRHRDRWSDALEDEGLDPVTVLSSLPAEVR